MPTRPSPSPPPNGRGFVKRRVLMPALAVLLSISCLLIAAELTLRLLPVDSGLRVAAVDAAHPVFHYLPGQRFVYSRDWNFSIVNRGRINNDGFVNDRDYAVADPRPLLAVVGDSYVEALMVPYGETFHGRLAHALGPRGRVYSFGTSGAPLSEYLIWAQHAAAVYRPAGLVINVVGNDFDESLVEYKTQPGFFEYVAAPDGTLELKRIDYRPGRWRDLVLSSALARYLIFNLEISATLQRLDMLPGVRPAEAAEALPPFVGNTASSLAPARVADSTAAIAAFFRDLPRLTGMPPDRILFLVDGARYPSDVATVEASYFGLMRRRFMEAAASRGYEVVDLQPWFLARVKADPAVRFEFPTDGHWNATGHAVVAKALAASKLYQRLFGP